MGRSGLHLCDSEYVHVAGCCKYGNTSANSTKFGGFFD